MECGLSEGVRKYCEILVLLLFCFVAFFLPLFLFRVTGSGLPDKTFLLVYLWRLSTRGLGASHKLFFLLFYFHFFFFFVVSPPKGDLQ